MTTRVPIRIVKISGGEGGLHLHARLLVNGKTANVVIDTGASRTVFDKERIEKFIRPDSMTKNNHFSSGLGTNSMESFSVKLRSVRLGKMKVEQYDLHLLDLSHVNSAYESAGLKTIDGVLGSDLLHHCNAVIDYEKREMRLKYKAAAKKARKK